MKKQIKSLISFCIAVIVFLAAPIAATPAYAAEENGISVSKSKISAGETFNVTITVPANTKKADTLSIRAEFDNLAFEIVKWEPAIAGANVMHSEPDAGFLSLSSANATSAIDLSRGLKFTATLKAKVGAKAGNYSFKLTKSSVSVFNESTYQNEQLWTPSVKTAAVEIGEAFVPSGGIGISVSKSKVSNGETFDVAISIPPSAQKADTVSIRAEFDNSAFEIVKWEPAIAGVNVIHSEPDAGFLSLSSANPTAVIDLSGGLKFTATLKAKDGAKEGNYSFTLTKNSVSYYDDVNNKNFELWNPDVKSVSVTVEAVSTECVHSLVKTDAKASTCEVKGNNVYYTCSKCGKVFKDPDGKKPTTVEAETLALAKHSGGKADCLHKAVCDYCGKPYGSLGGHSFGNKIAEKKATCQQEGMKAHYVCSVCGKYFTESKKETTKASLVTVKVSHDFRWVIDVSATATQTGLKHEECTYCGLKRSENTVIESHTHIFGKEWVYNSQNHWHECRCGEKNAVAPHISDGGKTIAAPTQTSSGYHVYACTVCGYEIRRDVIPPVGSVVWGTGSSGGSTGSGNGNGGTGNTEEIDNTEETETEESTEILPDADPDDGDYGDSDNGESGGESEDDLWERVGNAINQCEDGKTVSVDMKGKDDAVVPEEIFSELKGKNVGLRLKMGSGFSWKFHGLEIEEPQELDMGVELVEDYIDEELVDAVKNKLGSIQLSFNHEGDFGLTATLEIQVGEKNDGKYANLFYYNTANDCLDFTDTDQIDGGKAKLKLSHASEWLVTLSSAAYSGASRISLDDGDTPTPSTSNKHPQIVTDKTTFDDGEVNPNTGLGLVLILPAAAGVSVALVKKTKRRRGRRR